MGTAGLNSDDTLAVARNLRRKVEYVEIVHRSNSVTS